MAAQYLTIQEAAERLNAHPRAVWELARRDKLGAVNLTPDASRATWRIPIESVEAELNRPAGIPLGARVPAAA